MLLILTTIILGICLLLAEIVLPGGIAGLVGLGLILWGITMAYQTSTPVGHITLIATAITSSTSVWAWINWLPESKLGRTMFLPQTARNWRAPQPDQPLLGKTGTAQTDLRPTGIALINKKRINVQSNGALIRRGQTVNVVAVRGNRVIVTASCHPTESKPCPTPPPS